MMQVQMTTTSTLILSKLQNELIQKSWTNSDERQEDYRESWSQYRSTEQSRSENTFCSEVENSKICSDPAGSEQKSDVTTASVDEPMEIIASLNACCINEETLQENNVTSNSSSVKRARIVKPPEAFASEQRSTQSPQPFSFLAREKENRERRDARRVYYQMLTQKSSPQPFRARPAPKFKPCVIQTPKKIVQKPTSVQQEALKVTKSEKPAELQSKNASNCRQSTGSFLQSPKPIRFSFNSSQHHTSKDSRASITLSNITLSSSTVKSKVSRNAATASLMQTPINKRAATSSVPVIMNKSSTAEANTSKAGQSSQPRRSVTIPKSPQLSTAIRARQRQQFEEIIKEKERQRESLKKMEMATIKAYEQEEVARLRRSAVHRPVPIPQPKNVQSQLPKRPLMHPLLPIFVKRPRWI